MKKSINNKFETTKATARKFLITMSALLLSINLFAQGDKPASADGWMWLFGNGLFITLLGIIVFLIII